jgi:hypothetical protein
MSDVSRRETDELVSEKEAAHLLGSPANAKRLLTALQRSRRKKGKPSTVKQLRSGLGVGAAKGV